MDSVKSADRHILRPLHADIDVSMRTNSILTKVDKIPVNIASQVKRKFGFSYDLAGKSIP
jgi:hypothetical protein